jgi:DNA processing protein
MNRVIGLGAITVKKMAERFGSLGAVLEASEDEFLSIPGIGLEKARRFCADLKRLPAGEELAHAEKKGVRLVTWVDDGYPALLRQIADPPLVLYVAGSVEALSRPAVAIIGTRGASIYGRECARRFSYQLASAGYTVVSGLALGIDTEAHAGAVQAKGRTVAVLGGALDCLYPKENEGLARSIVGAGGAVVCEYPFGRQPDSQTFPMRNRIVSGLSKGVLVVESPLRSGTLITVGQALDQGRCVMAVPGRIDSPLSQGTHRLIREGARLVTTADEVIEELQDLMAGMRRPQEKAAGLPEAGRGRDRDRDRDRDRETRPESVLSPDERAVMAWVGNEAVPIDEVVRGSGSDAGKVNALLVGLQIKRLIRLLPGGLVARRAKSDF